MVGIIICSHGNFAQGIHDSGSLIFGEEPEVKRCILKPGEGPRDIKAKMEEAVASLEDRENVLFLVDLWGGTPFNELLTLKEGHESWAIVTGLNLPMLIDAYACRKSMDTAHEIALHIVNSARKGIRVLPEELDPQPW